jgi:predicted DNA-binding transcriptional regulator AlpA
MTEIETATPQSAPPPFGDLRYFYWDFHDLVERKIVRSRYQLYHLQETRGFPKPIKPGGTTRRAAVLWVVSEVVAWLDAEMAARDAAE